LLIWNKTDLLSSPPPEGIAVSALTGAGFANLLTAIDGALEMDPVSTVCFRIPAGEGAAIHLLHECGRILERRYEGDYCEVVADTPWSVRARLAAYEHNREHDG
jgi:50S ribosomal subunit-associated GTPase HflX